MASYIDKNNPVFNFISGATLKDTEEEKAPETTPEQPQSKAGKASVSKAEKKKQVPKKKAAAGVEYKIVATFPDKAEYVEKRTKRLQLVVQPSIYDKLKAAAKKNKQSVNDYIHNLLEDNLKEE